MTITVHYICVMCESCVIAYEFCSQVKCECKQSCLIRGERKTFRFHVFSVHPDAVFAYLVKRGGTRGPCRG